MAAQTVKVAISLPREAFDALEAQRKRLRLTRSALIARALETWLEDEVEAASIREYLAGYREHPETSDELKEAAAMSSQSLATQPWED